MVLNTKDLIYKMTINNENMNINYLKNIEFNVTIFNNNLSLIHVIPK